MKTRIPMFATANDTDQWAVCVDGYFGLFATQAEAQRVYGLICAAGQHFDDTAFGSCQLLHPGYRPLNGLSATLGEPQDMTEAVLSQRRAIDIEGYILKRPARQARQYRPEQTTAAQRLAEKRCWESLFVA